MKRDGATHVLGTMHMVDLGCGDDVDVVLFDHLCQVLRYGVLDRLCSCGTLTVFAEVGFDDASRSFAGAEARDANLAGKFAKCDFDVLVEGRFVNRYVDLDFVAFELFYGALHE